MKKILIISNVAWASLFLFMSFSNLSKNNINNEETGNYKTSNTNITACGKDAFTGLTLNELLWGLARYRQTHWDSINALKYMQQNHIQDARCCWYSLDTLKKYICFIDQYASSLHIPSDSLGMRFYYAIYSDKVNWYSQYKNHHTLFMVPTFKYVSISANKNLSETIEANLDFDPRYSVKHKILGQQNPHRYTLQEIYERGDSNLNVFCLDGSTANNQAQFKTEVAAKNQGQLCPPTCIPPINGGSKKIFKFPYWYASADTVENLLRFVDTRWPRGIGWKDPK